jgi:hypothetical protein
MIKTMRWLLGAVVGLLALVGVAAFVVHASVAEAWIRLTRKRRVPVAGGSEATYDPLPGRG